MKIETQFFSRLRDLAGGHQLTFDLPEGAAVNDLLARVYADFPAIRDWDRTLLIAVGLEFAERTQILHENDIVSVMPPVQGG